MNQRKTDIKLLRKGLKYLAFTLPLLFLSPYLLTLSFLNKDTFVFYIFFILGLIAGAGALLLWYRGIMTIMRSLS